MGLSEELWGKTTLKLPVILSFAPNLASKSEIRSKAQNDKRGDPTIPQRARFVSKRAQCVKSSDICSFVSIMFSSTIYCMCAVT